MTRNYKHQSCDSCLTLFEMYNLAGVETMASSNFARKLVSAASCLPIRRSQLLGSNTANGMTVARNQPKARYASSAAQRYIPEEKGAQLESRDDGAISRDKVHPLRVFGELLCSCNYFVT